MLPQGRCFIVTMIYPKDQGFEDMAISGHRAMATRRIFRNRAEAEHYAGGVAKCFKAKVHQIQGVVVYSDEA